MSTPALCTSCLDERDYPARRGDKLSDHNCAKCGATGTLVRAGRSPSKPARQAWLDAQPAPDGQVCAACGDNDHQAFECARVRPHADGKVL
ncbi:MAG TPA: hypothetical protein VGI39_04940 [Polyangiaceae bacterium]|jgi:hypothetical protein